MSFIKSINNKQAEGLISENKNLLIIDVRRFNEFKEGKIVNAKNIPVEELEWEIDDIAEYKELPVLVYCKVGHKSSIACELLKEEGFKCLYNLRGGILDYTGAIEK